jgi:hypothetical protein
MPVMYEKNAKTSANRKERRGAVFLSFARALQKTVDASHSHITTQFHAPQPITKYKIQQLLIITLFITYKAERGAEDLTFFKASCSPFDKSPTCRAALLIKRV